MKPEQRSGLARLMLRWPDRRAELERAAEGPILDLYESYEEASLACAKWARQTDSAAIAITEDYRRLLGDLEDEIANHLSK